MPEAVANSLTHGIQLNYVGVKAIHFESVRLPSTYRQEDLGDLVLGNGRSEYDRKEKVITVITKVEIKAKDGTLEARIELVAQFRVDESQFPADRVEDWAERAAYFVLLPFLREHLYSLSCRTGMPLVMMPLLQLPTFTVSPPEGPQPELFTKREAAFS
jgi:preprotein translocase subunit SecB